MEPVAFEMTTHRLNLKVVTPMDARELYTAIKESLYTLERWLDWARITPSETDVAAFIESCQEKALKGDHFYFLMFEKYSNSLVGCCELRQTAEESHFEIGYWARSSCEGRGFITEAVRAIAQFSFNYMKATQLEIYTNVYNERACRVAERAGFKRQQIEWDGSSRRKRKQFHNVSYVKKYNRDAR